MSWTPKIGDVIYTVGESKKEDVWDDTELIDHWEVAMEEYRALQGQSKGAPPFNTSYGSNTAEERQQPKKRARVAKNSKQRENSTAPSSVSNSVLEMQNQNDAEQDDFTSVLMSWYYAGYYTGYYQGQSSE